jgi:hypothetical protein
LSIGASRIVDQYRTPEYARVRHESPIPAIQRIAAIIPEHEVAPARYHEFAVVDIVVQHPSAGFVGQVRWWSIRKVIAEIVRKLVFMRNIRFVDRRPIQEELSMLEVNAIARNANYALD